MWVEACIVRSGKSFKHTHHFTSISRRAIPPSTYLVVCSFARCSVGRNSGVSTHAPHMNVKQSVKGCSISHDPHKWITNMNNSHSAFGKSERNLFNSECGFQTNGVKPLKYQSANTETGRSFIIIWRNFFSSRQIECVVIFREMCINQEDWMVPEDSWMV